MQSLIRCATLRCQGARIGKTRLPYPLYTTWPHRVQIGNSCQIEREVTLKVDGIYAPDIAIRIGNRVFIGNGCEFNIKQSIVVGDDCLIASGCRFIDHDHGMEPGLMCIQACPTEPIVISNNVWLGFNVQVLKGVCINEGAVVAAGAVVTKSIPSNEIWGGVPAKKIGIRQ